MLHNLQRVFWVFLALFVHSAYGLGLGEIELKSALNQPLKAEIKLTKSGDVPELGVKASLASRTQFEKLGIDYLVHLKDIRFKTVRRSPKELVIELTTKKPVKEPFLSFVVELIWPNGRALRTYTVLLDFPVFKESGSARIRSVTTEKKISSRPSNRQKRSRVSSSRKTSRNDFQGNTYGPVGKDQTLWGIASEIKSDSVSIQQALVALFKENPNAFINNDINKLKRGSTLSIPSEQQMVNVPHRAALRDIVSQTRKTNNTVLDASSRKNTAGANSTTQKDRFKISAPNTETGLSDGASGLGNDGEASEAIKQQLISSQEATETLKAENEVLRQQLQDALAQLEQVKKSAINIESAEGSLLANKENLDKAEADLSDKNVFEAEETLTEESDTAEVGEEESADTQENEIAEVGEETLGENVSTDDNLLTEETTSTEEATDSNDETLDPANQVASVDIEKTQVASNTLNPGVDQTHVEEPTSWMDNDVIKYGAIGGVLLLLTAFLIFWKMRQRMSDDEFQDDLVASTENMNFSADMDMNDDNLLDVDNDLLEDLEPGEKFDTQTSTTPDADPLGEADIYMAYGKHDHAEQLLVQAIEDAPERLELKVKHLECIADAKDKERFDAQLDAYRTELEQDEESMTMVAGFQEQAWPEGSAAADEFDLPSTEEIFGEGDFTAEDAEEVSNMLEDEALLETASEVDASEEVATQSLSEDDILGEETNFDTDDFDFDLDGKVEEPPPVPDIESEEDTFSLDESPIDSDTESDIDDTVLMDEELNDFDLSESMDFDMDGELDDLETGDAEEASTKLDLARAYIDMGDSEGAQEILREVIEEGAQSHKDEALKLLEEIQ